MKPITSRDISFGSGNSMKIRLGDILILRHPLRAINRGDLSALMPLAVLVVGLFADDAYFTLLGLDVLKYSISKYTKKGLVILSKKGKETEISEDDIVQLFKMFGHNKSSDTIDGLRLYLRTLITDTPHLETSSIYKTSKRLINMIDWPDTSLVTWANKHLRVPSQHVPAIEHLDNRQLMINHMIRLGITRAKIFSERDKKDKAVMEAQAGREELLTVDSTIAPEAVSLSGLTWDRAREAHWPDPNDRVVYNPRDRMIYYAGTKVRYDMDMAQAEKVVIQNMGERSFEVAVEPTLEWGTIDAPPAVLKLRKDIAASYGMLPEEGQGIPLAEPAVLETIDPPEVAEGDYYNEDDPDEMR